MLSHESILYHFNTAKENHYPYIGIAVLKSSRDIFPDVIIGYYTNFQSLQDYILTNQLNVIDIIYDFDVNTIYSTLMKEHNFSVSKLNMFKQTSTHNISQNVLPRKQSREDFSYQFQKFTMDQIREILASLSIDELNSLGYKVIQS